MFWLKNKKNNFHLHTFIWGPVVMHLDDNNRLLILLLTAYLVKFHWNIMLNW